jgi:hypothetical protein
MLTDQPSAAPTRKWWAMMIAGAVVGAAYAVLDTVWPGHPLEPFKAEAVASTMILVQGVVTYMTRNRT